MEEKEIKKYRILERQQRIYQGDRIREENNGNIKCIDISSLTYEELQKTKFHHSLKKDKTVIDKEGLKSRIGRNSNGLDKLEAIYFSNGIEAALEMWDVWLKWRAERLFDPFWQDENKNLKEALDNGTANEQEKKEYFSKCKLWAEEYTSKRYRDDKEKMDFLFDFQIKEMLASNYYRVDLKEGKDFSFDEIDVKKESSFKQGKDSMSYKKFKEMYGEYSDFESTKVDKWNMNTYLGKKITITPDRIEQLLLPNGKNDALSIVLFLYDKYKENVPEEQQVQFDLLDKYVDYVQEKIRNNELQTFDRNIRINEVETISHFHDQKSKAYFDDKQANVYSISEQQIGKATADVPVNAKKQAMVQLEMDEKEIEQEEMYL